MIVDTGWSTGTIAKDLRHIFKRWHVDMLDWAKYPPDLDLICKEYDAVIACTLLSPHAWPETKIYSVMCNGPVDFELTKNKGYPICNRCAGAVSQETYNLLTQENRALTVCYAPATARKSRFTRRCVRPELTTIGWCGFPASTANFQSDLKRYFMFEEIVKATGLTPLVSHKNYDYDTMHKFYESIDLLICTSLTEGGPLPVFEAIACGVPVISTDVGLVKETGIWKFETVVQAVGLINHLKAESERRNYANELYEDFEHRWCMEQLTPHWERFFVESARMVGFRGLDL
jgi:hypothetical protein